MIVDQQPNARPAEVATTPAFVKIEQETVTSNSLDLQLLPLGPVLIQLQEHHQVQLLI